MAEKKEKKLVAASQDVKEAAKDVKLKEAKPVGNAGGLRLGAVILWVCAIACEVLGIMILFGKLYMSFLPIMYQLIGFIVLDLIFVIIGAQLWKKANHIKPASAQNKLKFWLWNNMGVIVCVLAFVPYIILLLSNKNLDKKTKTVVTIVAIIALLIGGAASYEWNPVSVEDQEAAISVLGDAEVFWAPCGKVYHTSTECQALNRSETLTYGSVEEAIAAGRTRLCSFCAKRDNIEGVVTDDKTVE